MKSTLFELTRILFLHVVHTHYYEGNNTYSKEKKNTIYISLLLKINEKKKRGKKNKSLNICHLCEVWGTKIPKGSTGTPSYMGD